MREEMIGIRHEDKYVMERRTPLTPTHVEKLVREQGLKICIQESEKRIFTKDEYIKAGASIQKDVSDCPIILGVKEMPASFFKEGKTYIFFSHVIKGQPYNMPMLQKMMDLGCNLIDYEKVENADNKRLIFFGRFAGLAGMINSLWSLGLRLRDRGISNPFEGLKQSFEYSSLAEAKKAISEVGHKIAKEGLPEEICPFTVAFTGYGNVSNGAQEICRLLPVKEIHPDELSELDKRYDLANNIVYTSVFREENMAEHKECKEFELMEYYQKPENFNGTFEKYLPHISLLMNCMYWDENYPRILTKDWLEAKTKEGNLKLIAVGDITCDPDGSVEITHKGTEIEDPIFVYDPLKREPKMGYSGEGVLVMAVDILPSELPREASINFGDALLPFVKDIAKTDFNADFDKITLPAPIKKAMILHKGKLTPDYTYIQEYL